MTRKDGRGAAGALGVGLATAGAALLGGLAGAATDPGPAAPAIGAAAAAALAAALLARRRPVEARPPSAPVHRPPPEGLPARGLAPGIGRLALERLPTPLLLIDEAGRIVYANPAARVLFERLREGEHYSMSFRAPGFLDALEGALAAGGARRFEFALHGDRNRRIEAFVDGASLPDLDGGRRHAVCLFQDRTHDLRVARMRTDFVANASHELRTPLSSIKGFIETLQTSAKDDPEARERFLGIMLTQAERMQRLVDDLLSLSRIELEEHIAPQERLALGSLALEVVEAMGPMAAERGTELQAAIEPPGPVVRGDRDQLAQALGNLVENALKYGGGAPVSVTLERDAAERPGLVGLSVRDSGEGIPREHLPRLTERFYRVSVKRSRDQGGTGLGLAIVKHILSRHRGELEIESEPGEGSRFTLWLPPEGEPRVRVEDPRATAEI